jgi:DNA replication protein DnaC
MEHLPKVSKTDLGERVLSCDLHGEYVSTGIAITLSRTAREIWTPCPDCVEAKAVAERQAEAERLATAARERLEALLEEAAIPRRFIGRTLDNFNAETAEQKRALAVSKDFAENFGGKSAKGDSLIFLGAPGTGKSHLATAILQAILPSHCGLYTTCSGVIRAVRATWRPSAEKSEGQVLAMFAQVPLLVIDEIGVQYGTDSEQNILFDLLDRRYRDMMPTILMANLRLKREKQDDPAGLREVLGERVYDRLTEIARIVTFEGESYRTRARKEFS